jgi:hypothetical protein
MKKLLLAFLLLLLAAGGVKADPIQESVAPWYTISTDFTLRVRAIVGTWNCGRQLEWVRVRVCYHRYDCDPHEYEWRHELVLLGATGEATVNVGCVVVPGSYTVTVFVEYGVVRNFVPYVTHSGGTYMFDVQVGWYGATIAQTYPVP